MPLETLVVRTDRARQYAPRVRRPNGRRPARVHQVLRLPDERLRFRSAWPIWRRARATARRCGPEDADLIVLNTCHIRERASEKIYSELGKLRELKEARDAPAAGRRSSSPAASRRPKAPRSCAASRRWTWSSVRRATTACPNFCARPRCGRASSTPSFPPTTSSPTCRRAAPEARREARRRRLRDRAGGLRQVLLVLRRALHPRRGGLAPGRRDSRRDRPARPRGRAGGHADRPERQRLSRARRRRPAGRPRRPDRRRGGRSGRRAGALRDLASQRHERRPDRGARAASRRSRPISICRSSRAPTGFSRR